MATHITERWKIPETGAALFSKPTSSSNSVANTEEGNLMDGALEKEIEKHDHNVFVLFHIWVHINKILQTFLWPKETLWALLKCYNKHYVIYYNYIITYRIYIFIIDIIISIINNLILICASWQIFRVMQWYLCKVLAASILMSIFSRYRDSIFCISEVFREWLYSRHTKILKVFLVCSREH